VTLLAWGGFVAACAIGATSRYLIDGWIQDRSEGVFPRGTWVVNMTGSMLLGVLTGLAAYHGLGNIPKTILGTGFCGAYTTFSTFTFETFRLAEEGDLTDAARNVATSLVVGAVAAAAGIALAGL
jgi:fluoride exporter